MKTHVVHELMFSVSSASCCCPRMIVCGREGYSDGLCYVYVYIAGFSLIYNYRLLHKYNIL